LKAEQ